MTDWAAEIVMEILNQCGTDDDIHLDRLCAALRKAKACGFLDGVNTICEDGALTTGDVLAIANKIEKGET